MLTTTLQSYTKYKISNLDKLQTTNTDTDTNTEHRKLSTKFKEELNCLKEVYGDQLCTDLETFESTNKSIALQIVSGREGISLRQAEYLVYYNIDFSATSYWQSRDRMTTKDRPENEVFWIFTKGGIEKQIYRAVSKKKDYTLKHFKRDLLTLN